MSIRGVIKLGKHSDSRKETSPLLLLKNTKINAYVGYLTPVTNYASPAWFANKTESKETERVKRKSTIWIMGNLDKSYKQRLTELRLLPLLYYFELHDLLMLVSMLKGSYNIKLSIKSQ